MCITTYCYYCIYSYCNIIVIYSMIIAFLSNLHYIVIILYNVHVYCIVLIVILSIIVWSLTVPLILSFSSMSTISFMDEPHGENALHPPVRMENTFQLQPQRRFPDGQVRNIIREVLEGYLGEERYEPELCRQMTKTLSEVSQLWFYPYQA